MLYYMYTSYESILSYYMLVCFINLIASAELDFFYSWVIMIIITVRLSFELPLQSFHVLAVGSSACICAYLIYYLLHSLQSFDILLLLLSIFINWNYLKQIIVVVLCMLYIYKWHVRYTTLTGKLFMILQKTYSVIMRVTPLLRNTCRYTVQLHCYCRIRGLFYLISWFDNIMCMRITSLL